MVLQSKILWETLQYLVFVVVTNIQFDGFGTFATNAVIAFVHPV